MQAIASSTALASAEATAKTQIGVCLSKTTVSSLLTKNRRTQLVDCLKARVPPQKQTQFRDCLGSSALKDKVWTKTGREKLETTEAPNCVNAAA